MRIFVAGATGAVGRRLVPALVVRGHEVWGLTRSPARRRMLEEMGARPVVGDALAAGDMLETIGACSPDVVIHELTALTGMTGLRNFDRSFAETNRLRTQGTDNLLNAARKAGAKRFLAQSYGSWIYPPAGSAVRTEDDPLETAPLPTQRSSFAAIRHLEGAVTGSAAMTGIVLRYGSLYGPGTNMGEGGEVLELVRQRKMPIVGNGGGVWSFLHVDDAASATVAAAERGNAGIYNIADDEPAPVSEWLPELARALGAKPPWKVPHWLGRLAAGEAVVRMMTETPGMSNAKAKRELAWAPSVANWREGFRHRLGEGKGTAGH